MPVLAGSCYFSGGITIESGKSVNISDGSFEYMARGSHAATNFVGGVKITSEGNITIGASAFKHVGYSKSGGFARYAA